MTEENLTGAGWAVGDPTAIKQVTTTDSMTNHVVKSLTSLPTIPATAGQNWPGADHKLPFNANAEILCCFAAH